jgi:chromate transporter
MRGAGAGGECDAPSGGGSDLGEVTRLALKLGFTAFGGPAAHIAMLRQEVVDRRGWFTPAHFLDLIGITNLIPGPNSTEMVMHAGYERAGHRGLIAAGLGFILPAAAITLAFAVLYERYGTTPSGEHLLYGIQPVIVAIIAQAIWNLGRTAIRTAAGLLLPAAVAALYVLGYSELLLLFGGALAYVAIRRSIAEIRSGATVALSPLGAMTLLAQATGSDGGVPYSAARLFLQFLKIGSVLYGSGYVLIAFLRGTFVEDYGWLTEAQLLDAVAVGQVTPGPVFTTATFVGYLTGGYAGAVLATVAIFLPSFCFVAIANPFLPRMRGNRLAGELLDGVNLAALGLMAGVLWELGGEAVVDGQTAIVLVVTGMLLLWRNVNSAILLAAGAAFGLLSGAI